MAWFQNRHMQLNSICLTLILFLAGTTFIHAELPLTEARSTLEKWIETRQLISKTRADWQSDKELMEQTVALYERELKSIDDQMSKVSTNNTQVAREMTDAEALKKTSAEALDSVRRFAVDFEARLKREASLLPAPLQESLKPALSRMPEDPAHTKMLAAERIQLLVGALSDIDKFNNSINVFSEKRRNDKNEEIAVQSLYIGLGVAYFVNDTADFAGLGTPGSTGWEWTLRSELAPHIAEAVKIYRNERTARFVPLPVVLK
jgi:septal ring factor EnvC (AmiA/AmiB activator)